MVIYNFESSFAFVLILSVLVTSQVFQKKLEGTETPRIQLEDQVGQNLIGDGMRVAFNGSLSLILNCTAPYPVFYSHEGETQFHFTLESTKVTYSNFYDDSTHVFQIKVKILITNWHGVYLTNKSDLIHCQATQNNCLRNTIRVLQIPKTNQLEFNLEPNFDEECKKTEILQTRIPLTPICSTTFYYSETVGCTSFEPWNFQCDFGYNHPGEIKIIPCGNKIQCDQLPKNPVKDYCFKKLSAGETCGNCTSIATVDLRSFVAVCTEKSGSRIVKTNPIYFQFPKGFSIQKPVLFVKDDEELPLGMIQMKFFKKVQVLNSYIYVQCKSSTFYTNYGFQFAVQHNHNDDQLQLVPVSQEVRTSLDGSTNVQTTKIHLDDKNISRIYCFANTQGTFKWLNSSRSVRVVDLEDYYEPQNCDTIQGTLNPWLELPEIKLTYPEGDVTVRKIKKHLPFKLNDTKYREGIEIVIHCMAPYPIQLLYDVQDEFTFKEKLAHPSMSISFKNGSVMNNPKYFTLNELILFNKQKDKLIFRCQSVENPCTHESILYSYVEGDNSQLQFSIVKKQNQYQLDYSKRIGTQLIDQDESQVNECEVLFYYKKIAEYPGYEFTCEFPFQIEGRVNIHHCDTVTKCVNLYYNRRQPKECWRKVNRWRNCFNCDETTASGIHPFVVTCDRGNLGFENSIMGNFAFFGISKTPDKMPNIYFDEEDLDPQSMIFMEPLNIYQIVSQEFNVTCKSSVYNTVKDIQFVVVFDEDEPFQILNGDKHFLKLNKARHLWEMTQTMKFDQQGQVKIYCLGHTRSTVNASSDIIYVQYAREPQVSIHVVDGFEDASESNNFHDLNDEYSLEQDLVNQTIICHASGYPPPKIHWTYFQTKSQPVISETIENSTSSWRMIEFRVVHPGISGTYGCIASNSDSKTEVGKSIKIKVLEQKSKDKSWLYIVTPLFGALVVFFSITLFCGVRKNKQLKERLRNLTDEEIQEFTSGNLELAQVQEDDINRAEFSPFKLTIPKGDLIIGPKLAESTFGKIYQSNLRGREVAAKIIINSADILYLKEFLRELKIMAFLGPHPHIVEFLGADISAIEQRIVYGVLELAPSGSLKSYLTKNFSSIPVSGLDLVNTRKRLLNWCEQIADGMEFLESRRVIHADLSARNVLLFNDDVVKISDFGLSRVLTKYSLYNKKNYETPLPFAWMAYESLTIRQFSHQSDVWSFGVTMWELFSGGQIPFPNYTWDSLFINLIKNHNLRLQKPYMATNEIYGVMMKCWDILPKNRPSFSQLKEFCRQLKNTNSLDRQSNLEETIKQIEMPYPIANREGRSVYYVQFNDINAD